MVVQEGNTPPRADRFVSQHIVLDGSRFSEEPLYLQTRRGSAEPAGRLVYCTSEMDPSFEASWPSRRPAFSSVLAVSILMWRLVYELLLSAVGYLV